ncbi:GTP 3',8-cyclase MoaA [Niabella hibiscisoli]|uniref:GTP 3',8-cyclase MoaA n=1 Tax=Niabella hibiscisoli TaxID=1825928 RepID=UPI001F106E9D|nr:GTP 3',8-cyclase MoaA [Niabella hibiscisoli]MCH5717668.1 GTP 3',8-cyclase MoaA [Niabella hibiscisoli]
MLIDRYNRVHNYLRISLTDNCNFRCFYCMPEEDYAFTPQAALMQADEIERLAKIFVGLGVNKIRLTGGEPLVRKDAGAIISALSKLPVKLSLTTNGVRLHDFIDVFKESGINSINISLDTLQAEKFQMITRRDSFHRVMDNIGLMLDIGMHVKINVVVMAGLNDNELLDFVAWTKEVPVHVRFIEFMPFAGNRWTGNKVFTWQQMLERISDRYSFLPLKAGVHETAKAYIVPGHKGTFSVISTMSAPFCSSCNRIRLTADGKLKNCLFAQDETDVLSALRTGADLERLIKNNIAAKAMELGGQFNKNFETLKADEVFNRSMIAIGG